MSLLTHFDIRGASRTAIVVASSLVIFQVADIISTMFVLGTHNAIEANPVMASVMGHFGSLWWLFKLKVVLVVAGYILTIRPKADATRFEKIHLGFRVFLFAIAGYAPVVINLIQYFAYLNGDLI